MSRVSMISPAPSEAGDAMPVRWWTTSIAITPPIRAAGGPRVAATVGRDWCSATTSS
jgi:hypothetical protein